MIETDKRYKLIGPFSELLTMADTPIKGAIADEKLSVVKNGGILMAGDKVFAVGAFEELTKDAKRLDAEVVEVDSPMICLPGFIDSHTHICFGGSRAMDYSMRNAGKSYLEIAKEGGGIWDTVSQTRQLTKEELTKGILSRASTLLKSGITTVEVKSGYGLSVKEELKMLLAIKQANNKLSQDLIPTCLAAHIFPKDYDGDIHDYIHELVVKLLPVLLSEKLTKRVDAFIEESAFTRESITPYFKAARSMGFDITVHADQFHTGGSEVAVEFGALSADHLEVSTEKEIMMLAKSNVIATALPGASIGLGCAFTPARKILDAGGSLAIASDWNPGSAPMGDLLIQASVLATFQKLSNAEVLAGITTRAAAALGLQDRGQLIANSLADFNIYQADDHREVFYQQGMLKPYQVWKNGSLAFSQKNQ